MRKATKHYLQKIFSLLTIALLVTQSLVPGFAFGALAKTVFADEPPVEETVTPDPTPTEEVSPAPTEEATPAPTEEVTPTIAPDPTETPTPTDTVEPTPTEQVANPDQSNTEPPKETGPPPQQGQILDGISTTAEAASTPLWQSLDRMTDGTIVPVELEREYRYRNTPVTVVFTSLPENPGTLTIREVKLTAEQIEELGAFSDTAYEITSSMEDGTFNYNLTLPLPGNAKGKSIDIKSGETVDEVTNNGEVVDEPKEVKSEIITITGLDHFTVFVLVNNLAGDDETEGTSDDVANGVISAIDDAYVDEADADGFHNTTGLHVRSSENADRRTFINFDLDSIDEGSIVTKATLRLFTFDDTPAAERNYQVYRVTEGWDEESLTWNNQPSVTEEGATTNSSTPSQGSVWMEFNVTDDVQNFIDGFETNYGWLIKDGDEDSIEESYLGKFRSTSGSNIRRRPQLVVDFIGADVQTEYNSPTTEAEDEEIGNGGNGFEGTPEGAFSDGGEVASNENGINDRHVFSDYEFAIPGTALINGIDVRLDWYLDLLGEGTNSMLVELSGDGGESWTDPKEDIVETNREHVASLGGENDLWNAEWIWTPDNFSDANFKVRVTSNSDDPDRDFYLDWIPVRVYYSDGGEEEDTTPPTEPVADPAAGDYTTDQSVSLSSTGESAIYYTTDGSEPDNSSSLYSASIPIGQDTTLKAIAYDEAGNVSSILTAVYGIAPVISGETFSRNNDTSLVVSWTTDAPATSRVVYDTVSHPALEAAPNYGYANSTVEDSTEVTSHSVTITGLTTNVTYYYRTVSHGSPETVGEEQTYTINYVFGVGGGDGKSDGKSDGGSSGGIGGLIPASAGVLGAIAFAGFNENVLGTTTEGPTESATFSPTPETEEITLENVLGENTASLPWWFIALLGVSLLSILWWLRKRSQQPK